MDELLYWRDIPEGRENAVSYDYLQYLWGRDRRAVRRILNRLSREDNGDNFVLIRSAKGRGGVPRHG